MEDTTYKVNKSTLRTFAAMIFRKYSVNKHFIVSLSLISFLYLNTTPLYASYGRAFDEQAPKKIKVIAHYPNKQKIEPWVFSPHITFFDTLLLLAIHFQPFGVNPRTVTYSTSLTSHDTIESSGNA